MQSRNYQDLSRGDDDRDFRQGHQDGAGRGNNSTSEYGNYGMRDDHSHYDSSQQGSGHGGSGSQGYQGGQQYQGGGAQQGGQQGYRGGSFDTSQGGSQYGEHSSQQSRQGANNLPGW